MLIFGAHTVVIADQPVLGGAIGAAYRDAGHARDARNRDDLSAARAAHARQKLLGQSDRRAQIDADDLLIDRKIDLDRKAPLRGYGVVDDTVDPSAVSEGRRGGKEGIRR